MANTILKRKNNFLFTLTTLIILLGFITTNAHAKPTRSKKSSNLAAGLSTDSSLLNTSNTAVSALYFTDSKTYYQMSLNVSSLDPAVYSLGGYYKMIYHGSLQKGIHIGGGFGLGSTGTDSSFWRLAGNAGAHLLFAKRFLLSVDANIAIGKNSTNNISSSTFTVGGNSALLGASLYLFL